MLTHTSPLRKKCGPAIRTAEHVVRVVSHIATARLCLKGEAAVG